jgi:FGGY-family pentulose kinase
MDACLGIDVGTGSVRAGLFDLGGRCLGRGVEPIELFRPAEDFVEQSSDDIWRAVGAAVRQALGQARVGPEPIVGIGFDATSCSLVALDAGGRPVSVSPTGRDAQNVIVWMDHRATSEADRISGTGHPVLRYVGGRMSPEMQTPKLLWLFEQLPRSWERARHFFDLPDFLVYRATGGVARSLCSTTCKGTYLAHEDRWDADFFRGIGLGGLADEGFARIGTRIQPLGERAGTLTSQAARELGLAAGIPVAVSIIDAHAGGLGSLGFTEGPEPLTEQLLEERLALIGGTSTCHVVVSREPRFVPGVWGPYYAAMVPGLWLSEAGQSATGALLDHVVSSHARGAELLRRAAAEGSHVHALLNARLQHLERSVPFPAALTRDLHVYPDFHGNRSPLADPSLRGMISGLRLSDSVDALALSYLATVQAVAHGTRHIIDVMNAHGHRVRTLVATGGDAKNPLFLREHADATGCPIVLPREPEAVLLGSAMLGAVASGAQPSVIGAMQAMSGVSEVVKPAGGEVAAYHALKHEVFQRMVRDQLEYRRLMTPEAAK